MFIEAIEGLAAAGSLYERRKSIYALLQRLGRLALNGNVKIAVFGPGGAGKTTLGTFLSGDLDTDKGAKTYQETLTIENFGLAGSVPGKLIVPPGQIDRRPRNWDELFALISSGKTTKIINLVAWGYHSTEVEKSRIFPEHCPENDDAFRHRYLSDGRERELQALEELVPHLRAAKHPIHMITLVNKQDLWWHERLDALDYFTHGPYSKVLSRVQEYKGAAGFQHDIVSAALVQQNLKTADGFVLANTAAGYDDALRVANLSRAASAIQQMIEK